MTIQANVTFEEKVRFIAQAESGHCVTIDGPQEAGGANAGFRPMQLMLLGLGGCMAFDVLMIRRRMRQDVRAYRLKIQAERAADPPRVFTEVRMEHVFQGEGLKESSIQQAIDLAVSTYCSASAMFAKTAKITNTFLVVES